MMLTNYQLLYITKNHMCTQDVVDGICSADHIPIQVNKYPAFWILNNRPSSHKGEHWYGCFFPDKNQPAEMFCSFGKSPQTYSPQLEEILKFNGNGAYIFNNLQLQDNNSKACAYFTLYYIDRRCRGLSFQNSLSNLSPYDLEENEEIVIDYVKKHMIHQNM